MTEKRFKVHIKWFNYEKTEGEIELFDNGQPLLMSDCVEDVQCIKSLLNKLNEEKIECENEIARLQMIITKLKDKDYDNYTKKIQKLSKENNELKTTNAELEDYTARIEEELMNIRTENTKNKLILKDVVEDLEKQSNSNEPIIIRKDYIAWIKKNANLKFIRGKKK